VDWNLVCGIKKKLKEDLKILADMVCMAQDVIAMQNIEDIDQIHAELRETLNRIVCIALRSENPGACQTLMQWIVIISGLIDCCNKLKKGERVMVPGVTRHHLQILIDCL